MDNKIVCWKCLNCGHLWLGDGMFKRCTNSQCRSKNIVIGWNTRDEAKYEREQKKRCRALSKAHIKNS